MKLELNAEEKLKELEFSNLNLKFNDRWHFKTELVINATDKLYERLKNNYEKYFYIDKVNEFYSPILFSPKQALQIIHNILGDDNSIVELTEGYFCYHTTYCEFVAENKDTYILYSKKDINTLVNWLCAILKIGGYDIETDLLEQNVNFKINIIDKTTECSINNEIRGLAKCKKTDKFDFKKGKLISFARALDFDNETVERIIDALFPQE